MGDVQAKKTVVLGAEYDEDLRARLTAVLKRFGGAPADRLRGVAGSQDLDVLEIRVGDESLTVESETYVGLSITGSTELVDRVLSLMGTDGKSGDRDSSE